ncbi:4-hydroxy-4-methyl-2-oxoglutarate aldolase [Planctomycetes bacterium Pan216]|uniref:Putative 4-hydroxy-4-methyl-2-oxoglutarate aldolase n=1 Tax=Kolteria novifilia TaxID=2527975 RepID=A0A518BAJ1_9BACT|nr:4-hydroxy-4-methyl-2-oxoglutarate aldolase [Planctomycetes bacterium Pan216]
MSTLTAEDLELLKRYDTPTIDNVIELFDVRPRNTGFMDPRIKACFPDLPPMVGFATTATFRSGSPPRGGEVYASLDAQVKALLEIPAPRVVVFQDLDDQAVGATFGEVMCTTYKAFGGVGIITSGGGRDLDQVRSIEFPAFVQSVISSHAYCQIVDINVPVRVGGVTIHPGDLIHGDLNGVTTIPKEIAGAVGRTCDPFIKAEEHVLHYVRQPGATPEGFSEARARMTAAVAELKKKVRG